MSYEIISINDTQATQLAPFRLSETQLLRFYEPKPGLFLAESEKVVERALLGGYEPVSFLADRKLLEQKPELYKEWNVPVYAVTAEMIRELTGSKPINGAIGLMRRKKMGNIAGILNGARRVAVLEHVENPTNVGAIFRSAAALGMDAVILSEDSGDPLYRRSARVSMGTVFQVPWIKLDKKREQWIRDGIPLLKEQGFSLVGMALTERTESLAEVSFNKKEKLAVLLGNEAEGLTTETIDCCDHVVKIPMAHGVDSLNVSAASAVAFWVLGNR